MQNVSYTLLHSHYTDRHHAGDNYRDIGYYMCIAIGMDLCTRAGSKAEKAIGRLSLYRETYTFRSLTIARSTIQELDYSSLY